MSAFYTYTNTKANLDVGVDMDIESGEKGNAGQGIPPGMPVDMCQLSPSKFHIRPCIERLLAAPPHPQPSMAQWSSAEGEMANI
jgi:hypothetical protein